MSSCPLLHFSFAAFCSDDLWLVQRPFTPKERLFIGLKLGCSQLLSCSVRRLWPLWQGWQSRIGATTSDSSFKPWYPHADFPSWQLQMSEHICQAQLRCRHVSSDCPSVGCLQHGGGWAARSARAHWPSSELQNKPLKSRALTDEQRWHQSSELVTSNPCVVDIEAVGNS